MEYHRLRCFFDHLIKPYINTTLTNCEFEKDYYIDLSRLGSGCTVTLNNCTCNGVKITANNYSTYITIDGSIDSVIFS